MNIHSWLTMKGIDWKIARAAGVEWDTCSTIIKYPRKNIEDQVIGWKVRDIATGRQWNSPGGVPLKDTVPFISLTDGPTVWITEGETDALAAATYARANGIEATIIASPGASSWQNEWAGMLSSYHSVYVFPDPDDAGNKFANSVCATLPRAKVVDLPLDLSDSIVAGHNIMEFVDLASHRVVAHRKIRRTGYTFKPSFRVSSGTLLELVSKDVKLRRRGKEFVGLCPFHEESTPSFMINPDKGVFYCQGCMAGGDAITYLMKKNGITFGEAKRTVTSP
jgi:DNA primase